MKQECYRLIQEIAVLRNPICKWCWKPSVVGHHLFKRDRMATAFLPEAVWGMCHECHQKAHGDRALFEFYAFSEMGERYYDLERLSNTVVKNVDFKTVKKDLKKVLANLRKWV